MPGEDPGSGAPHTVEEGRGGWEERAECLCSQFRGQGWRPRSLKWAIEAAIFRANFFNQLLYYLIIHYSVISEVSLEHLRTYC